MGRRSINTTKSGKYMNPTDQARKEARKKELKKNKKQRQMVRAAVLKGKDPAQLIEEMEKIDEMGLFIQTIFLLLLNQILLSIVEIACKHFIDHIHISLKQFRVQCTAAIAFK